MLDKKSIAVLKVLNKLSDNSAYKVTTNEEIISMLNQKSQYDGETIKQIIDFLSKQEYIVIKFSEDNTYCYSLLPKARILLEQDVGKTKVKKQPNQWVCYLLTFASAFLGTLGALFIFFYLV